MSFCLPRKYTEVFRQAVKQNGTLNPDKLRKMTSAQRLDEFTDYFGKDNAQEVNALFEEKLLLKDQRAGMRNWVNQLQGLNEESRKALQDQINSHRKILDPAREKDFLASLAAKKLGTEVTASEAKEILGLSDKVLDAKETMRSDDTHDNRINYGLAVGELHDRVRELKEGTFDPKSLEDWKHQIANVGNIPRTIMSNIDLSAPFVQGWGMISTQRFWEGMVKQFQYFASEDAFKRLKAEIVSHPDYEIAQKAKLGITDLGSNLVLREEGFQSDIVEKLSQKFADYAKEKTGIPVPNPFRASARAFTGFLDYVRFTRYTDLLNAARAAGEDVKLGSDIARDLAKVVNDFTGRGAIGINDSHSNLSPIMSTLFFAPRKLSATINMFNPTQLVTLSPTARLAYVRQLAGSVVATAGILSLAKATGADVDLDPISQDFLKIKFGKTKFDVTGGNAIYARLIARLIEGQLKNSRGQIIKLGEGYKPQTRASLIGDFLRGKFAPISSFFTDALYGSDGAGQPFDVSKELKERVTPMTIGSFMDLANSGEKDDRALITSLSTIFGVGIQSPIVQQRMGVTPWGGDANETPKDEDSTLNDTLTKVGYFDHKGTLFPPKTFNGVKLTDGQYHDYIKLSGAYAKQLLLEPVQSEGFQKMPQQLQLSYVKSRIGIARQQAGMAVMQASQGTPDDIFQKSVATKLNGTK